MGSIGWLLELVLLGLLGATLVHAIRLERALRSIRQDRAAFGEAIAGFDQSAREAEQGVGRLRSICADAAQALTRRVEQGAALKDDLAFLIERGESIADRLETLVRTARSAAPASPAPAPPAPEPAGKLRSQAERDLLLALRSVQ